jgi:AGCS family alanine or glycine:cation symporter
MGIIRFFLLLITFLAGLSAPCPASAEALDQNPGSLDQSIDRFFAPITEATNSIVFFHIYSDGSVNVPFILVWLAGGALFLTLHFRFINLRAFALAFRTVAGRYSRSSDPGEITHFQALSSAISGTVGLGNIAGVAIAISKGGPGAVFWMVVMGLLGMTSKFAECTLGVRYRHVDKKGKVHGGAMMYLTRGLAKRKLAPLGRALAVMFAFFCVGGALGGGNMFQVNQAVSQFVNVTGGPSGFTGNNRWLMGLVIAVIVGLVIVGGISRIGKVTERLVPLMTATYIIGCFAVLFTHADRMPETFSLIFSEAFSGAAISGGMLGVMLIGIQRAAFSNEAGVGSAPIAHAAVKTRYPASEGIVALLEPFLDTVVICTMTALVVICTGDYMDNGKDGITITSESFSSVVPWFKYVLAFAVILFALSTLITWSYYGIQAWKFIFGKSHTAAISYKVIFLSVIVVGAAMAPGKVIDFSDAVLLAMCFPNLIGVYILLPEVRYELKRFLEFTRTVDK